MVRDQFCDRIDYPGHKTATAILSPANNVFKLLQTSGKPLCLSTQTSAKQLGCPSEAVASQLRFQKDMNTRDGNCDSIFFKRPRSG